MYTHCYCRSWAPIVSVAVCVLAVCKFCIEMCVRMGACGFWRSRSLAQAPLPSLPRAAKRARAAMHCCCSLGRFRKSVPMQNKRRRAAQEAREQTQQMLAKRKRHQPYGSCKGKSAAERAPSGAYLRLGVEFCDRVV